MKSFADRHWLRSYLGSYVRLVRLPAVLTISASLMALMLTSDFVVSGLRYLDRTEPGPIAAYFMTIHGALICLAAIGFVVAPLAFAMEVLRKRDSDSRERVISSMKSGFASAAMLLPWVALQSRRARAWRIERSVNVLYYVLLWLWLLGPIAFWFAWTFSLLFSFSFVGWAELLGRDVNYGSVDFSNWYGRLIYLTTGSIAILYPSMLFTLCFKNWRYALSTLATLREGPGTNGRILDPDGPGYVFGMSKALVPLVIFSVGSPLLLAISWGLLWIGFES